MGQQELIWGPRPPRAKLGRHGARYRCNRRARLPLLQTARCSRSGGMDDSGSTKHGRRLLLTPGRKAEHAAAKSEDPLREIRRSIDEGAAAW